MFASISVDSEGDALALMPHHLRIAASLFEGKPENPNIPDDEFASKAFSAFVKAMESLYPDDSGDDEVMHFSTVQDLMDHLNSDED